VHYPHRFERLIARVNVSLAQQTSPEFSPRHHLRIGRLSRLARCARLRRIHCWQRHHKCYRKKNPLHEMLS